jgi:predicted CoA-binding protein
MTGQNIAEFLKQERFAVFGVCNRTDHPGYKILKRLKRRGYKTYPVNPRFARVGSMRCYGTLDELPTVPQVVVVTDVPPESVLEIMRSSVTHGVRRFWIEPASESDEVLTYVSENGLAAVHSASLCEELSKR